MSLWGKSDNITSAGTVKINYTPDATTGEFTITGTNTQFGTVGAAKTGDVIRIGIRTEGTVDSAGSTFFGDAVITDITSSTSLTIGSTTGLADGVPTTGVGTHFYISELPSYSVGDYSYSEKNTGYDKIIYGVSVADSQTFDGSTGKYRTDGSGWVGVQTYVDCDGNFRVKSEILVAIGPDENNGNTGITTGSNGIAYPTAE